MTDAPPPTTTPDAKKSVQEELEELRTKGISSSNAKTLDALPATPLNMDDWQAQQRSLKEKDRQSKTAAASNLQQYRGLSAEEAKLTAIRNEERQKQLDAQNLLHNYKADLDNVKKDMTKVADKQLPQHGQHVGGATAEIAEEANVSVSELASSFDKDSAPGEAPKAGAVSTLAVNGTPSPVITADAPQPEIPVEAPTEEKDTSPKSEEWVNVKNSDALAKEETPATEWDHVTVKAANTTCSDPEETPSLDEAPIRLDVEFYFVLLTISSNPNTDGYMNAVADCTETATELEGDDVRFNPHFGPFVRSVDPDTSYMSSSRPATKKYTVHASVPVFLSHSSSEGDFVNARATVLKTLRETIQDGSFTSSS